MAPELFIKESSHIKLLWNKPIVTIPEQIIRKLNLLKMVGWKHNGNATVVGNFLQYIIFDTLEETGSKLELC